MLKNIVYFLEKKYSMQYPVQVNHFSFSFGGDGYCELAVRQTSEGEQILLGAYQDKGKVTAIDSTTGTFSEYKIDEKFNLTLLSEDVKTRAQFLETYQRAIEESLLNAKLGWVLHLSRPNYITLHYIDFYGSMGVSEFDPTVMAFRLNVPESYAEQLRVVLNKFKVGVINEQTRLICAGL